MTGRDWVVRALEGVAVVLIFAGLVGAFLSRIGL